MSMGKKEAKRLVDLVLAQASFGDVRVRVTASTRGHLRFGAGCPTTAGDVDGVTVEVTASKDGRTATVTGSRTDEAAVAVLVQRAEGLAGLSPVDPEHMPPLSASKPPKVKAEDGAVKGMSAKVRADLVGRAIRRAEGDRVEVAGLLDHEHHAEAVGNRAGLFVYHARTEVSLSATCRTDDGTGSARGGYVSHALRGLVPEALVSDAATRASASQLPGKRDPGRYPVILTSQAVADLLEFLVHALDARRAGEGRSAFSRPGGGKGAGKGTGTLVGETLFDGRVHLWSDPTDPANPADPFEGEGRAQGKVDWVVDGELRALHASRYWADREKLPDLPTPSSLHMDGGTDELEALIAGFDRGVLISRFWYNRMLDPQRLLVTGLTRDGTFWVEKGKIVEPIRNFRFNDSPLSVLKKVVALGRPQRAGLSRGRVMVVPPLVVSEFELASGSDAV
ncbi:TldD/PmbA family protein [Paraliomyxa miuraensis]|uniref:TldD/PmbA family protein n=1 Tax=Paraliomyxa miuraensis TaxID=376150 RepID=UPI002257B75A|nr:TldD/PmbA family protein [Paraliomyxa miuraensis]MCX4240038.1 TldD/PmbA family protein [Paraliomyxa miuraensis]